LTLFLVRHGRPRIDRARPSHDWPLDPGYDDDVYALRPRLPVSASWFSSPEPKAYTTARLLTESPIEIVGDLREQERHTTDWIDDFDDVVHRAFARPDVPAYDGWEPLADTRRRVVRAVDDIVRGHPGDDVVLVGHGTAWTLVCSHLTGRLPDLALWSTLRMPDVVECRGDVNPSDMLVT
jgi:broad specificity phosphatase PhoE